MYISTVFDKLYQAYIMVKIIKAAFSTECGGLSLKIEKNWFDPTSKTAS